MAPKRAGLGRGLDALIQDGAPRPVAAPPPPAPPREPGVLRVAVDQIARNPQQPRQEIQAEALEELVQSIREMGVLQPLLVRPAAGGYELIAGERRLTAARAAGLADVPVIVVKVSDREALEIALVENLQREDLNPIEEAEGYRRLGGDFGMTQEQISQRVGKGRASVTNALRLLQLPEIARDMLKSGGLTTGHAKAILGLEIAAEQELLAQRVARDGLSVRQVEAYVARARRTPRRPRVKRPDVPADHLVYLQDRLQHTLGTAVSITSSAVLANGRKAKGQITIDYHSADELDRLLGLLGVREEL